MKSNREVASGVVNLGSTCYMNAVLQALAHSPELCSAIECESHHKDCPIALSNYKFEREKETDQVQYTDDTNNQNIGSLDDNNVKFCLLCEIEKHLIEVHSNGSISSNNNDNNDDDTRGPVAPSNFVNGFISHVAPWFKLGVQEDSHEFLRLLIEAMQKSCIGTSNNNEQIENNINNMNGNSDESKDDTGSGDHESYNNRNEYAFRLFRGTVESIVKCSSCKSVSSTIDPIEDIGLEVTSSSTAQSFKPRGKTSPSPSSLSDITTSLEKFVTMEKLDSGYKCESCGKVGNATKQSRLASIPPILTLHLKRFRYGNDRGNGIIQSALSSRRRNTELASLLGNGDVGTSGSAKIEGHVKFSMVLDIRPYLTEEKKKEVGRSVLCRLFAVVVHDGKNSHSGHYICYVRNIVKNEWWKMDDAKVTRASTQEVMGAEAYMLFYRVVDHPVSLELRNKEKELEMMKEKAKREYLKRKEESIASTRKRKREEPKYKSGDEWARAVTNLPQSWLPYLRKIQDVLSDHLRLKTEYFDFLEDEAKSGGKLGAEPSVGIEGDDIQGGINGLRSVLKDMLKAILPERKDVVSQILNSVDPVNGDSSNKEEEKLGISTESDTFLCQLNDDANDSML